ncbi:MAG TPA: MFS transporter [Ignavibacteriales bacterium]|nr:MFS transporter [Ignavibacteriales bacterium]
MNEQLKKIWEEIAEPFKNLFRVSKSMWGINISYLIEGLVYFGMLTLMVMYFNNYVKLDDIQAGRMVGFLTAGITLAMLFLGATVDWIGIRKALIVSILLMLLGRFILFISPLSVFSYEILHIITFLGLLGIILGYGIYQPACYAAVKQFTDEKDAAMGYAMLYALMNLGGFLPGIISPIIRNNVDKIYPDKGILAVYFVYILFTIIGLFVIIFLLTEQNIKNDTKTIINHAGEDDPIANLPAKEKIRYYIKNFPLKDLRFMYFIFILIPVQTLFAHNWLTLPVYCERAFKGGVVSENFEFFSNINPLLIFVLTPIVATYTSKANTYKMMILGTFVMAIPTFILATGATLTNLLLYLFLMTIGEAMWQPRFLQWVAEIAPKGMTGIYMGLGQFPWFLTKIITSLYSGWFLMKYCPQNTPIEKMNTEFMWLIYGFIAIISPLGLFLAKNWMIKGFKETSN